MSKIFVNLIFKSYVYLIAKVIVLIKERIAYEKIERLIFKRITPLMVCNMLKMIIMKNYKKYKALYSTAYIVFFSYLLILSVGNFDFGKYEVFIPYFITIPFLIYILIAIFSEIKIRKSIKVYTLHKKSKKNHESSEFICNDANSPTLSNI